MKGARLVIHTEGAGHTEFEKMWKETAVTQFKFIVRIRNSGLPYAVQSLWNIQQSLSSYNETRRFVSFHNSLPYRTSFPYARYSEYISRIGNPVPWVTKRQFLWEVTLCWVSGSRRFEGLYRLHLQGSAVQLILPWLLDTEGGKTIVRNAMKHSPNDIASLPTTTASSAASPRKRRT